MCGIMGYAGAGDTVGILLEGLRRLEYRGYDSAGLAVATEAGIEVVKTQGKIVHLAALLNGRRPVGAAGLAHTRWATHGPPTTANAHPHLDCRGRIVVVHNGIIENYLELKAMLQAEGHVFQSQTDTEVFAHLIERNFQGDLERAVRRGLRPVIGSYAVVAMAAQQPGLLVAARQRSPLIIGLGGNGDGNFLASDPSAMLPFTRRAQLTDDGELVVLTADSVAVSTLAGKPVRKPICHLAWDTAMTEKDGHEHFMLKEIMEQPQALRGTLQGRVTARGELHLEGPNLSDAFLRRIKRVAVIACGTASHAGLVGRHVIESLCGLPVLVDVASEMQYREAAFDRTTLALAISQSGETADTLQAIRTAKRRGAKVLAITNVAGSSVTREADGVLLLQAGPEIGVASTKAYTCQLTAVLLCALHLARVRETITGTALRKLLRELARLPDLAQEVLANADTIRALAKKYRAVTRYLYLGRGPHHATALEGALKLKEIAYLDAEGHAAGEMKHGPLALVEEGVVVLAAVVPGPYYEKTWGNLQEVRARGARVIAIAHAQDAQAASLADDLIPIPKTAALVSPVLAAIPMQLYAYYLADLLGREIDQPRNLAKSVTVE